jgi:chromosome segregation ATPase
MASSKIQATTLELFRAQSEEDLNSKNTELASLLQSKDSLQAQLQDSHETNSSLKDEVSKLDIFNSDLQESLKGLEEDLTERDDQLAAAAKNHADQGKKIVALDIEVKDDQNLIGDLQVQLAKMQEIHRGLEGEIKSNKSEYNELLEEHEASENDLADSAKKLEETLNLLNQLKEEHHELEEKMSALQKDRELISEENLALKFAAGELNGKLDELNTRIEDLEGECDD